MAPPPLAYANLVKRVDREIGLVWGGRSGGYSVNATPALWALTLTSMVQGKGSYAFPLADGAVNGVQYRVFTSRS